jgi:hypothetical protein
LNYPLGIHKQCDDVGLENHQSLFFNVFPSTLIGHSAFLEVLDQSKI